MIEHSLVLPLPARAGLPPHERVLRARLRAPTLDGAAPSPWVLLVPGYLAAMDWAFLPWLERGLHGAGLATLAVTLSGSGFGERAERVTERVAFEHNTYAQELEDLERAADWAATRPELDPERRAVFGHSRGSAMALVHAAERGGYRALCSWATVARVGRYDPERIELWRRTGRLPVRTADGQAFELADDLLRDFTEQAARYDLEAAARSFAGRALLVHGARDRSVPLAEARAVQARFGERAELLAIPGTGHNFGARHPTSAPGAPLERAIAASARFLADVLGA